MKSVNAFLSFPGFARLGGGVVDVETPVQSGSESEMESEDAGSFFGRVDAASLGLDDADAPVLAPFSSLRVWSEKEFENVEMLEEMGVGAVRERVRRGRRRMMLFVLTILDV